MGRVELSTADGLIVLSGRAVDPGEDWSVDLGGGRIIKKGIGRSGRPNALDQNWLHVVILIYPPARPNSA